MLTFLRKHQKVFFIFITVVVVISFSFFGTYGVQDHGVHKRTDKVLGTAIDGSKMQQSEIDQLSLFLSSDGDDLFFISRNGWPNFLNDGVIAKDFIETGIADLLVEKYFSALQSDFQRRFEQMKKATFYTHPAAPFLSAKEVWKQFMPRIWENIDTIQKEQNLTPSLCHKFFDLYQNQKSFPPEMMKKILFYQQSQSPWIAPDQKLLYEDFSLFGFDSLQDWFGKTFVDLASQFIYNTALLAEQKGYEVSYDDALFDLMKNVQAGMQKIAKMQKTLHSEGDFFKYQLRVLGLDEKKAVNLWKKVILFRKYFQDVGNAILVDQIPYQEFHAFSEETAVVDLYELPKVLECKDFHALELLQTYFTHVSDTSIDSINLPEKFWSIEKIEQNSPELVTQTFELNVAEVNVENLGLKISERELWKWQKEEDHWKILQKEFSLEKAAIEPTEESYLQILDKLPAAMRVKVDQFSRKTMVFSRPEWIQEELQKQEKKPQNLVLRLKGGDFGLLGISDRKELLSLLEKAPLTSLAKETLSLEQKEIVEKLSYFTQDLEHFYSIEVTKKPEQKVLLSFEEAKEDGTLDHLFYNLLQDTYLTMRKENPSLFQKENGDWKKFSDVKDVVERKLFHSLFTAIDKEMKKTKELSWDFGQGSFEFYASYRFFPFMQAYQASLIQEKAVKQHPLWNIEVKQEKISRAQSEEPLREELFSLKPDWSSIYIKPDGKIFFFHHLGFEKKEASLDEKITAAKEALAKEAKKEMAREMIELLEQKQAISLTTCPIDEKEVR